MNIMTNHLSQASSQTLVNRTCNIKRTSCFADQNKKTVQCHSFPLVLEEKKKLLRTCVTVIVQESGVWEMGGTARRQKTKEE